VPIHFGGWLLNTADNHLASGADYDGDHSAEILATSPWGMGLDEYNAILEEYARAYAADEDIRREHADEGGSRGTVTGGKPRISLAARLGEEGRQAWDRAKKGEPTPGGFVDACLRCYRANFDPSGLAAEAESLEAEHTALMERWADLPKTPRVQEKAKERFAALEARIEDPGRQQQDAAEVVATHYRELHDLQRAIAEGKLAMQSEASAQALRRRAEALRGLVCRIECTFTATGETGGGWGKKNARLATVTIYPVVGEAAEFSAESKGTLMYSRAHSCM
jgi:hypothetical protein